MPQARTSDDETNEEIPMTRFAAAFLATTALAAPALAETAVGLTGDKTLVWIDTATAAVTGSVEVQGVDRILGLDLRPSDNMIYGVTADQRLVSIDHMTGATTEVSKFDIPLELTEGSVVVDFNPAADKLRFMSGTVNHRVDPATGAVTVDGPLAFVAEDMHAGEAPMIVAAAYTNSFGKPEKTAMFNIDSTIGGLIQQTAPNDGTLAAIGKLGVDAADSYAFDIATTADGTNTAWLVAGMNLHTVDLATGAVNGTWAITGADAPIRDITVLPAM
jgi:hypothetical protein